MSQPKILDREPSQVVHHVSVLVGVNDRVVGVLHGLPLVALLRVREALRAGPSSSGSGTRLTSMMPSRNRTARPAASRSRARFTALSQLVL